MENMAVNLIKRKWDIIPKEKRDLVTERIINYLKEEWEIDIGIVAAGEILDFFQEELFEPIYNQAIEDARRLLRAKFEDMEWELDILASS